MIGYKLQTRGKQIAILARQTQEREEKKQEEYCASKCTFGISFGARGLEFEPKTSFPGFRPELLLCNDVDAVSSSFIFLFASFR